MSAKVRSLFKFPCDKPVSFNRRIFEIEKNSFKAYCIQVGSIESIVAGKWNYSVLFVFGKWCIEIGWFIS